jgi:phosphoglycerate dehydrogenase-like enzyme
LQPEQIIKMLAGVEGYIAGVDYITEEVIKNAPDSLKVISRYGVGIDRVDIPACTKKGIYVTNTPGANATAVAELAFALMLNVAREIPRLHNAVENGEWISINGTELKGKTLGIIGMGAIGKTLATRALAFGMDVCAYDPYFDEAFAKEHGIAGKSLKEAVAGSDFISLHLQINDQTKNIIDAEMIKAMKDGAVIINASRGGLIDERCRCRGYKERETGRTGAGCL